MTLAMIWVLAEMGAPWWCYVSVGVMFLVKAFFLIGVADRGRKNG